MRIIHNSIIRISLIIFLILCTANSYSQNINRPDINCPSGIKVNSFSQSLYYGRTDLKIPCRGISIDLTFSYNNVRTAIDLGYGNGWSMTYSIVYTRDTHEVKIRQGIGRKDIFTKSGTGWKAGEGSFDTLYEYSPGQFQLKNKKGDIYYFEDSTHKRVTKISEPNGNALVISYTNGLATLITDPAGRSVQLNYSNGHLASVYDPNFTPPRTFSYSYDASNNMIGFTDPLGKTVLYEYDSDRLLNRITNQNSVVHTIRYEESGFSNRVALVSSPLNTINIYVTSFAKTKVIEMVNNVEQTTHYIYGCGLFVCDDIQEKSGSCCGFSETYQYDAKHNLTKKTDANSNEWQYRYDSKGNMTKLTGPLSSVEEFTYDLTYSNMLSKKDKNGNLTEYDFDSQGNLVSESIPLGITKTYTYDINGNITSSSDGNGNLTTYSYNSRGDKTLMTFPNGSTNSFVYDNAGNMTSSIDGNGNVTTYEYDALNREIKKTDGLGNSSFKSYDGLGNVISKTDELGRITTYQYDALNRNTKIVSPAGTRSMTYDSKGNLLTKTDGNGNITRFTFDNRNLLVSEINALGNSRSCTYDAKGNKLSETDFSGNLTTYQYDALNRVVQVTDALSHSVYYTYDPFGNRLSSTDANGNTTNFVYDALNRLTRISKPIGTESITYDNNDNRTSVTDANGNSMRYTYDNMNRIIASSDALGNNTLYTYDLQGNMISMTDRNGHTTTYGYDALNRQINEVNSLRENTIINYNSVGRISSRTMPNGNTISFTYDAADRIIQTTDMLGSISITGYDANSNIVSESDGNGLVSIKKYDKLNRMILQRDPMGNVKSYAYNNDSKTIRVTDRNARTSVYGYDNLHRKTSITSPEGNVITMTYDNNGNKLSITDDNGKTTGYAYDANNRLTTETYPNGTTKGYIYDAAGNIINFKDNNGNITSHKYDKDNVLLEKSYYDGTSDLFTYDNERNLTGAINRIADVRFTYDGSKRILSETMNGKKTEYFYDIPGNRRVTIYPSGRTVESSFDVRDRLIESNSEILVTYSYDNANRLLSRAYSNGVLANYSYNNSDFITSVSHVKLPNVLAQFNYGLDREGNRMFAEKTHYSSNSEKYSYDADDRIVNYKEGTIVNGNIASPITQSQFNYDGVGNRTSFDKDTSTTLYTVNNVNAYTSISGSDTILPTYDNNGNTLTDGDHSYEYNPENKLVSVDGGSVATYKYDALGRRIQKITSSETINFYYDNLRIVEERDESDAVTATFIYGIGIDDVVSMQRDGTNYSYHQNSLGSVIAVTDNSGVVAERYEYDAYGKPQIFSSTYVPRTSTAVGNRYMFTGREYDSEIRSYHYRARLHKPVWGRFGQWDNLGYEDGMNMYEYSMSNTVNNSDPFGLSVKCCKNNEYIPNYIKLDYGTLPSCMKAMGQKYNNSYEKGKEYLLSQSQTLNDFFDLESINLISISVQAELIKGVKLSIPFDLLKANYFEYTLALKFCLEPVCANEGVENCNMNCNFESGPSISTPENCTPNCSSIPSEQWQTCTCE